MGFWAAAAPVIGAVAGGLLSRGGGSESQPGLPSYVEDRARQYAGRIDPRVFGDNYNPGFYGGIAPQSPFTKMAIQGMGNFSNQPSQDYWSSVMQGNYLGGGSQGFQNAVMNPAIQGTNAAFNQMGRFGSEANMENTAEAAARAYAPFYNAERDRMGQAAQFLPQLQAGQLQQQLQAGQLMDARRQGKLDMRNARQEWYDPSNVTMRQHRATSELLQPLLGMSPGTPAVQGQNPWQGAMGGALMGASLYNNWGGTGGGGALASASPGAAYGTPVTGAPNTFWNNGMMTQFPR